MVLVQFWQMHVWSNPKQAPPVASQPRYLPRQVRARCWVPDGPQRWWEHLPRDCQEARWGTCHLAALAPCQITGGDVRCWANVALLERVTRSRPTEGSSPQSARPSWNGRSRSHRSQLWGLMATGLRTWVSLQVRQHLAAEGRWQGERWHEPRGWGWLVFPKGPGQVWRAWPVGERHPGAVLQGDTREAAGRRESRELLRAVAASRAFPSPHLLGERVSLAGGRRRGIAPCFPAGRLHVLLLLCNEEEGAGQVVQPASPCATGLWGRVRTSAHGLLPLAPLARLPSHGRAVPKREQTPGQLPAQLRLLLPAQGHLGCHDTAPLPARSRGRDGPWGK